MNTLTTTMEGEKCPRCGADVRSQDTFCWNCGRSLRNASPLSQQRQTGSQSSARLVVMTSAGEILRDYLLDKAEVTIGRVAPANIVLLKSTLISRRHASVRYEQDCYVLRDERSANGTFVNGMPLAEMVAYRLQDGDQIGIGEYLLVFHAEEGTAEPPHACS